MGQAPAALADEACRTDWNPGVSGKKELAFGDGADVVLGPAAREGVVAGVGEVETTGARDVVARVGGRRAS